MSAYPPPIEESPIFNPTVFTVKDTALTISDGEKYFLKFPQAQGTQNFTDINVGGIATIEDVKSDTLEVAGNADLNSNLDVSGVITGQTIAGINARLDAEATARDSADTTLQDNITAEATARGSADTTLQDNITTEATARGSADTTLQDNITAEATARVAGDALKVSKVGDTMTGDLTVSNPNEIYYKDETLDTRFVNVEGVETITGAKTFSTDLTIQDGNLVIEHLAEADFYPYILLNSRRAGQVYDGKSSLFLTEQFQDRDNIQGAYIEYDGGSPNTLYIGTQNQSSGNPTATRKNAITIARNSSNVGIVGGLNVGDDTTINGDLTVSNPNEIYYKGETLDARFHSLDNDYYTEAESDARFVNVEGDTMPGDLTINNAHIGAWGGSANFCSVSHSSFNTTGGYALIQSNGGETYLNSSGTNPLHLRQNNVDKLLINSSGDVGITNNLQVGGDLSVAGLDLILGDEFVNTPTYRDSGRGIQRFTSPFPNLTSILDDEIQTTGRTKVIVGMNEGYVNSNSLNHSRMEFRTSDGEVNLWGSRLRLNDNAELTYKNQTLDARFVNVEGDTMSGLLNLRADTNGEYLRFNGERSWLWYSTSSGGTTDLRLKDEGNGKWWRYMTANDTEWARWFFDNNLSVCKLEFLGGSLTMSNNTEIHYKGETLDNRFVPKLTFDNRQVNWSEIGARRFEVLFGSWANNNTAPYADCIHFNTWGDGSGGKSNLLCLKKNEFGMRIYKPTSSTYQNTTNYTDYRDVVLADTNGNVGIGIDAPISKLHIYQNSTDTGVSAGLTIEQDGGGDALIQYLTTSFNRWTTGIDNSDGDKFKIRALNGVGDVMGITTTGNVDITNNLTVDGSMYLEGVLRMDSGKNAFNAYGNAIRINEGENFSGGTRIDGAVNILDNATIGGIAEVVGDLSTDSDLIVGGVIRKSSYPLITHTHSFYQSTSYLSNQWLLWTSVRDTVTDGVRGMKFPYAIKPYAVSISAEADGLEGLVNVTVKVFKYPNTNNNSNIQSVAGAVLCGFRNYDIVDNCAFCDDLEEPVTIDANTTWGVYLQKGVIGSVDDNPEIIVMIHCHQV